MDNIERDTKLSTADITQAGEKEYEARHGQSRPGERIEVTGQRDPALNRDDTPGSHDDEPMTPLYTDSEASSLRSRWEAIQLSFVDEPRGVVQQADRLVAESIRHLAEGCANQKNKLEDQWAREENVSTEDLRISLRRYRSFFERLLAV